MKNTMHYVQLFLTLKKGASIRTASFANSKVVDIHHRDMKK